MHVAVREAREADLDRILSIYSKAGLDDRATLDLEGATWPMAVRPLGWWRTWRSSLRLSVTLCARRRAATRCICPDEEGG
jgi:hypothetical protein